MHSKRRHKKQHVYNMRGCSSKSRCGTKKKRTMKGGCGDTCPMTNHSMIGGYVRGPSNTRSDGNKRSDVNKRRDSNKRSGSNKSSSSGKRSSKSSSEKRSSSSSSSSSKRSGSTQKGGNIFSDVVRGVAYNGGVLRNAIGGYAPPVSPSPYADQFRSTFSKV
jgi:hypothetical protein